MSLQHFECRHATNRLARADDGNVAIFTAHARKMSRVSVFDIIVAGDHF
jgi:hypothetical protein